MPRPPRTGRFSAPADSDNTTFRPQLTSLIDVMTFLLVFLIKSFSVQGDVITPSTNLQLPISTSQKAPRVVASIEITKNGVSAEGKLLATIGSVAEGDSLLIPGVFHWMSMQHARYADSTQVHEVMIQADRESEYAILKRVMYSCSRAGFSDFTILAVQKE
jgi:biopolymer transport protein ExbD